MEQRYSLPLMLIAVVILHTEATQKSSHTTLYFGYQENYPGRYVFLNNMLFMNYQPLENSPDKVYEAKQKFVEKYPEELKKLLTVMNEYSFRHTCFSLPAQYPQLKSFSKLLSIRVTLNMLILTFYIRLGESSISLFLNFRQLIKLLRALVMPLRVKQNPHRLKLLHLEKVDLPLNSNSNLFRNSIKGNQAKDFSRERCSTRYVSCNNTTTCYPKKSLPNRQRGKGRKGQFKRKSRRTKKS